MPDSRSYVSLLIEDSLERTKIFEDTEVSGIKVAKIFDNVAEITINGVTRCFYPNSTKVVGGKKITCVWVSCKRNVFQDDP